jgi:hypothetical protein
MELGLASHSMHDGLQLSHRATPRDIPSASQVMPSRVMAKSSTPHVTHPLGPLIIRLFLHFCRNSICGQPGPTSGGNPPVEFVDTLDERESGQRVCGTRVNRHLGFEFVAWARRPDQDERVIAAVAPEHGAPGDRDQEV